MDVVAKTGERQRRSGVSKWNFGGGLRYRAACGLGTQRVVVVGFGRYVAVPHDGSRGGTRCTSLKTQE